MVVVVIAVAGDVVADDGDDWLVFDVVVWPLESLTPGGVRLEGASTGAVPPAASATCTGLSCFGLSFISVPCTALATWEGTLPPVVAAGGEGGPPPAGVTENWPGRTGTVWPAEVNSTCPWVPMLTTPLTPLMWNTMKYVPRAAATAVGV